MSFFSWVERLILKKTSLLLSVTLMFKCSTGASPGGADSDILESGVGRSCEMDEVSVGVAERDLVSLMVMGSGFASPRRKSQKEEGTDEARQAEMRSATDTNLPGWS